MNWAGVARCRWRLLRNHLFAARGKSRGSVSHRRPLLGALLAVALAALICMGLAGLFGQLASEGASALESAGALALVLTLAIVGLLVFDLHEAVSTLVTDSDLELLRRAPITGPSLFLVKLADAFPRTSLLVMVLAVPAALAFHLFYPLPIWAWLLLPVQLAALWAIPLGVGIAIALLLLRRVPARRAREALGLLSTVTLFVLWLLNSFLLPRLAVPEGDPFSSLRSALSTTAKTIEWSPGAWAAAALAHAAAGEFWGAAGWTLALGALTVALLAGAAWIAASQLETMQIALAVSPRRARGAAAANTAVRAPARRQGAFRAILARDARLFFRDWTLLGDVITAAVLWTLLPLVGAPLYESATAPTLGRAMLIALTVGLGYEVAGRAIPFERHGWAWMKLVPVRRSTWIAAKFAGAAALSLPLVALAATSMAIALDVTPRAVAQALAVVVPALVVSLSVGLWTGAAYANPAWTNPRGMLTVTGRIVATTLLVIQSGAWLAFAALLDTGLVEPRPIAWMLPSVLAIAIMLFPLRATARLLDQREWRA